MLLYMYLYKLFHSTQTIILTLQYFNSGPNFGSDVAPNVGSEFVFTDYCPFESPFSVSAAIHYCSVIVIQCNGGEYCLQE
jgi:hypothetical protein